MSYAAHATFRSLQNSLDRMFPRPYPTFDQCRDMESHTLHVTDPVKIIYDNAHTVVAELKGKGIPAADLTEEQKCALFTLAGFMKYEDGKMVSIRPVGIADDGRGGYIVGITAPPPTWR